jgi:hypothetical protein
MAYGLLGPDPVETQEDLWHYGRCTDSGTIAVMILLVHGGAQ